MTEILKIRDQAHYDSLQEVSATPFGEQVHTLLLDSVGKIADQWIEQLAIIRDNANTLEKQLLACVAQTKADITALHELGVMVGEEARRGQQVCLQLINSVEKIT